MRPAFPNRFYPPVAGHPVRRDDGTGRFPRELMKIAVYENFTVCDLCTERDQGKLPIGATCNSV